MDAGLFRNDKKKHPDELEPMIISPILTEREPDSMIHQNSTVTGTLDTIAKSHWKSHHSAAGYTKWMSVIDANIIHTWIEVHGGQDIILDFMDSELLQLVLTESALLNTQFHILFDLAHISSITFEYKQAITDLFFNWSPILGVVGFYNIADSMRIIVETFAAIAPEKICVILTETFEEAIEHTIAFKAGNHTHTEYCSEKKTADQVLKKRFLEAIARISWLDMLDEQITMPPSDNHYYPFFKAIDSLRSDLVAKEAKKESELQLLKEDFEHRITQMVIKINAQTEVNKKSTRDLENEIAALTRRIASQDMELTKFSAIITDKKKRLLDLLDKLRSLEIEPDVKNDITNSCLYLINKGAIEKQPDIELTKSDSLFIATLQKKFPDLSPRELRIGLLVKLNYDTSEIAHSIGLSTRGMESIRYRMHKKLGLGKHQSIKSFLSDLVIS